MKRFTALLLALMLTLSLGVTASAKDGEDGLQVISCPEMEFSTVCGEGCQWKYTARDGITIYTERKGSIPYVLVFRSEDWIVDVADYIREQYTPHMKKQYGDDLVSSREYDHWPIGGRDLAVGVYTYRLQGYLIDMIRAYEVQDRHTVVYTAKYIRGSGEKTLRALEQAVAGYRPDPEWYGTAEENPRWKYSVSTTPGGDICCSFGEVMVTLPGSWAGMYSVKIGENGVTFYNSLSRRLWEEDGSEGGRLFTLAWYGKNDYDYLPSYDDLGKAPGGYYCLIYPTDVQAYNSPMAMEEYEQMYSQIDFVAENSYILP